MSEEEVYTAGAKDYEMQEFQEVYDVPMHAKFKCTLRSEHRLIHNNSNKQQPVSIFCHLRTTLDEAGCSPLQQLKH